MFVLDFVKKLIKLNFSFISDKDLNKASEFIITDLKYFRTSNIEPLDDSEFGVDKGFTFFVWNIPTYKKLWYMITNRYPIISDISIIDMDNQLVVNVNGRKKKFVITKRNSDYKPIKLEIDISSNIISYRTVKPV